MERLTRRRSGELARKVFEILEDRPGGLTEKAILEAVERHISDSAREQYESPFKLYSRRLKESTWLAIGAAVKAGWLSIEKDVSERDVWVITEEGRRAYARFEDPERFMKEAGRLSTKGWLSVSFPNLYSFASSLRYQLTTDYRLVRRIGPRKVFQQMRGKPARAAAGWRQVLPMQAPRRVAVNDLNLTKMDDLSAYLSSAGAAYTQCDRAIYLPPSAVGESAFKALAENYPHEVGIMITESAGEVNRGSSLVANVLFNKGIGPRVYDVVEAECGGCVLTAYVVEHITGRVPASPEREVGLEKIRDLESQGLLKQVVPIDPEGDHFDPRHNFDPHHNLGNRHNHDALIDDAGRFRYLAFQNFRATDYEPFLKDVALQATESSHWGDRSLLRGGVYLYQSIPGLQLPARRDTEERIGVLKRLMDEAGVSVKGRLVLDVGCNIGLMMAQYLKLGARWCHGWDRADVTPHTERLLLALGCTRFSTSGGDISKSKRIEADLPDNLKPLLNGCAISYLAVRGTLGWLDALARVPWSFMIYEGHEDETEQDFEDYLEQLRPVVRFRVAAASAYKDGDSDVRTIAILVRETD